MMVDIFSSFDPATSSYFSYSSLTFWAMSSALLFLIHPSLWLAPNRLSWPLLQSAQVMYDQSNRTFMKSIKGYTIILTSLFIVIIVMNFSGMLPYIFSPTSHLIFTLSFGLPLWLSLVLSGIIFSPSDVAAGLLPGGAPSWLNPFLILIETASLCVRPITLSFRLAANMSAGHIVLTLTSTFLVYSLFKSGPVSSSILFMVQTGYNIFEFGICLIQAYIFCLLLTLYSDDHPH